MRIINHGVWTRTPDIEVEGVPFPVMTCQRDSDALDWYVFQYNNKDSFAPDSVFCVVRDNCVEVATPDPSRLFPQGATLIEIREYDGDDPQAELGGKIYDAETATFTAPEPIIQPVSASSAKLVLADDGIYDQVEAICLAHPVTAVRIFWNAARVWERGNPYVMAVGAEMQLTDSQIDDMFARALLKE